MCALFCYNQIKRKADENGYQKVIKMTARVSSRGRLFFYVDRYSKLHNRDRYSTHLTTSYIRFRFFTVAVVLTAATAFACPLDLIIIVLPVSAVNRFPSGKVPGFQGYPLTSTFYTAGVKRGCLVR